MTDKTTKSAKIPEFRVMKLSKTLQNKVSLLIGQTGCKNYRGLLTEALTALEEKMNSKSKANGHILNDNPLDDYDGHSEKELVQIAQESMAIEVLTQKAVISEAKRLYRANQPTTINGTKRLRATNSEVQAQIHALVQNRMILNDQAKDWTEQRCINTSWIQKGGKEDDFGRSLSENIFNFKSVKQYLESHKDEIDQHHRTLGILKNHNMRVPKELKRREKKILTAGNEEVANA